MKIFIQFITIFISLFITACAPKNAMLKSDALMASGAYSQAAKFASNNINTSDSYAVDNLLWQLQSGNAYFFAQDINKSLEAFDTSEAIMKYYREQIITQDIAQTLKSTLLNDTTRPYIGTEYDGIMANTYKAISYMAQEDTSAARVEFNRAIDRQRRAKIFFSKMIQKEKEAREKKEEEGAKSGKNYTIDDSLITNTLNAKYPSLQNFESYPDFINPLTTYLAGIFAKANNDHSKAQTLLKEAFFMMPNNTDVKTDFEQTTQEPTLWVIFENGQAPILKEFRIDFPMWIFSNNVSFVSIALPKLIERNNAISHLNLVVDNEEIIQTKFLSSMDRVIKTEFKKNYNSIVRRALLSAATKAAISYAVNKNNSHSNVSTLINIATAIYQVVSTQADTRIWSTLPKEFQLARFKRPKNGKLKIQFPNNGLIKAIDLPQKDHILIYVKIATPYSLASVRVIPFGD